MKRSAELRGLSEEHHHGLVAARRLRLAAEGKAPLAEAIAWFLDAWRGQIQPHFRAEEEVLLPEFARARAPDDPLIVRTLTEHVGLRRAVRDLTQALEDTPQSDLGERQRLLAGEIGRALEAHIRFEERILFPAIESALLPAASGRLADLGREPSGGPRGGRIGCGLEGRARKLP
ncbi:MAG: hemerythrin domain-containing protein [Armatimonadetes bacterium]|nr:hemerythrin domain-containing protein [Armatimonadota bacterium]